MLLDITGDQPLTLGMQTQTKNKKKRMLPLCCVTEIRDVISSVATFLFENPAL